MREDGRLASRLEWVMVVHEVRECRQSVRGEEGMSAVGGLITLARAWRARPRRALAHGDGRRRHRPIGGADNRRVNTIVITGDARHGEEFMRVRT